MLKLLQKEFILEPSRIQSERMGTVNHMKDLYDAARHLVWLTQFGLSVVLPPVLFLLGAVWLRKQFGLAAGSSWLGSRSAWWLPSAACAVH